MLRSGRSTSGGLDSDSETVCCVALSALTHLFSWVPLSSYITSNLVAALFRLASIPQVRTQFLILTLYMLQENVCIYTVFSQFMLMNL